MIRLPNYLFICLFLFSNVNSAKLKITSTQSMVHFEGYIQYISNRTLIPKSSLFDTEIYFVDSNAMRYNATITSDGTYEVTLPSGLYNRFVKSKPFQDKNDKICIQPNTKNYELKNFIYLLPDRKSVEDYEIRGDLKVATTNELLEPGVLNSGNAFITFTNIKTKKSYNATFPTHSAYLVRLPIGEYRRVVRIANFSIMNQTFTITNRALEYFEKLIFLSPIFKGYRLVLTWGDLPKDLDISVTLPNGEEINFDNRVSKDGSVSIDIDSKNGFGPETISLLDIVPGTYKVHVAAFTNEKPLQESKAKLTIFRDSKLLNEYNVPSNGDTSYSYWQVLKIDHPSGKITPINQITLLKNPSYEE
jgi:hypothetical protein